jgi:Histidine kinase-like ATPase domain
VSTGLTASSSRSRRSTAAERAFRPAEGGLGTAARWPLSAHLPLGALPTAVPCARAYIRVILDEWGLPALADSAELIVSELVTNGVKASADEHGRPRYSEDGLPVVHLRLACDQAGVLVEVWDSVPRPPAARRAGPDEENGRGLALIQALSDRWGWTTVPGWPGKVVWAELRSGGSLLRASPGLRPPRGIAPVPETPSVHYSHTRGSHLGKIRAWGKEVGAMVHWNFPEARDFPGLPEGQRITRLSGINGAHGHQHAIPDGRAGAASASGRWPFP